MKSLFFILFITICSFAQFREGPGPVPEFTYDSTKYMLLKYTLNWNKQFSMDALMLRKDITFDQKNEIAYVKSDYWIPLPYAAKDEIATYMAVICGNANKNYRYPLTIKLWETKQTVGTFIVSQEDLGLRKKYEALTAPEPTNEIFSTGPLDSLYFERLQMERRIIVINNKILIKDDLWNAWDNQLQKDMIFMIALAWGNYKRDYSYNPEINIVPDVEFLNREEKANKKIQVITKSFRKPSNRNEFYDSRDSIARRWGLYYQENDDVEELLEGEKDKVSFLVREKMLYINHTTRTAYIQPDVWFEFTDRERKLRTILMAIKCGNECRDKNYKITVKNMQDHSQTFSSYRNNNFRLASL